MLNETISNSANISNINIDSRAFFSWYDYVLFISVSAGSGAIGIYFGCFGSKQVTKDEYMLGDKKMRLLPTILSLITGHVAGPAILGIPADTYFYGVYFIILAASNIFWGYISIHVFLPVLYELQLTSMYEYLEMRFDRRTRQFASALFTIKIICTQPLIFVLGSFALSTASGISFDIIAPIFLVLCVFYTTIGGIKTVIWTDTLQFIITYAALIVVMYLAIKNQGVAYAWQSAKRGGRLDIFNFEISLTQRDTFWSFLVGQTMYWAAYSSSCQSVIQKILSVPDLKQAKIATVGYTVGLSLIIFVGVFFGIMIYARYEDCDPFTSNSIDKYDEILPYFVSDISREFPGLSGLFVSGIFCTVLSTLSSNLNSLACTTYEDFLKSFLERKGFHQINLILRLLVILIGAITLFLVYVVAQFQSVYVLSWGVSAACCGPVFGLYILGALIPNSNSKGAFWGSLSAFLIIGFMVLGTNYYTLTKQIIHPTKDLSIQGCAITNSSISPNMYIRDQSQIFVLFRISYAWISVLGTIITVAVGIIISYIFKCSSQIVPKKLLSPIIYSFLPKEKYNSVQYSDCKNG